MIAPAATLPDRPLLTAATATSLVPGVILWPDTVAVGTVTVDVVTNAIPLAVVT